MAYYKNLLEYVQVLEREGLLFRVKRPINKDTEMHPLVRWQFRGLEEEQRRAFLFEDTTTPKARNTIYPFSSAGWQGRSGSMRSV
jgi:3-polyprenyl-4-hydroxybenzoate decarboxylase